MLFILKILISGTIIAVASEVARRSASLGALIVSIPITSLLTVCIIYLEGKQAQRAADFLTSSLWGLIPPIIFFILCPILIKNGIKFWPAMGLSFTAMTIGFIGYSLLMRRFNL